MVLFMSVIVVVKKEVWRNDGSSDKVHERQGWRGGRRSRNTLGWDVLSRVTTNSCRGRYARYPGSDAPDNAFPNPGSPTRTDACRQRPLPRLRHEWPASDPLVETTVRQGLPPLCLPWIFARCAYDQVNSRDQRHATPSGQRAILRGRAPVTQLHYARQGIVPLRWKSLPSGRIWVW